MCSAALKLFAIKWENILFTLQRFNKNKTGIFIYFYRKAFYKKWSKGWELSWKKLLCSWMFYCEKKSFQILTNFCVGVFYNFASFWSHVYPQKIQRCFLPSHLPPSPSPLHKAQNGNNANAAILLVEEIRGSSDDKLNIETRWGKRGSRW